MFSNSQLKVVKFCAEECRRQNSGELSVANMVNAWARAVRLDWNINLVLETGFHVEPEKNVNGFRRSVVTVNGEPIPWETISRNIETLMGNQAFWFNESMADEFYQAFERIHPFIDGNGRVGAILYNMLLERMGNPITLPMYKE